MEDSASNKARTPIYAKRRMFLGARDLVVSFYTKKCQFKCSYCALPQQSSTEEVAVDDLIAQIDHVFETFSGDIDTLQQLSFGNEGSALDDSRFHPAAMDHLLGRATAMRSLRCLSIETRPEYVNADALERVLRRSSAPLLDITVGFETQDDGIRNGVLNKSIRRKAFEQRLQVMGSMGVRLTSYVMVKPAPRMTEEQGVSEAISTISYLADQCARFGVPLIAYLTPLYIAAGSRLATITKRGEWTPPTIQSVAAVIDGARHLGVPVYVGIWSEGLAEDGRDYRSRPGYDPDLRKAIVEYNKSGDFLHLDRIRRPVAEQMAVG